MTTRRVGLTFLCLLLAGCGFMRRTKSTFYSLDTVPAAQRAAIAGAPIGVDGVELPPGIDRREIVIRGANHELQMREREQWSSNLEEMVIHTLAFDLANRLPEGMVILPGQAKPAGAMRSLYITFEDLAPGADRRFVLDARWTLAAGTQKVTAHEQITVDLASTDSAAIAAGMSRALAMLADRIVGQLAR